MRQIKHHKIIAMISGVQLIRYSESSFTDPHDVCRTTVASHDPEAFSQIGKSYEGVEPNRYGGITVNETGVIVDPDYRDFTVFRFKERVTLRKINVSTAFFAGNPADRLTITLIDDLQKTPKETKICAEQSLDGDSDNWFDCTGIAATRVRFDFAAGGIARAHFYGDRSPRQPLKLVNLTQDAQPLNKTDEFYGGPPYALSAEADRRVQHMKGWETSRKAYGLTTVVPVKPGKIHEVVIDTYRHVNNSLRYAWVLVRLKALPEVNDDPMAGLPDWQIGLFAKGSMDIERAAPFSVDRDELAGYMRERRYERHPEYRPESTEVRISISEKSETDWWVVGKMALAPDTENRLVLNKPVEATHLAVMLLPHGGLHAIRAEGIPEHEAVD